MRNALALIGILTVANGLLIGGLALVDKLFPPQRRAAEVVPLNVRRVDRHLCRPVPAPRSTAASAAPRLAAVPTSKHPAQRS